MTFFLYHPPTTDIYTLSLHDALPISELLGQGESQPLVDGQRVGLPPAAVQRGHQQGVRSEEHTSELQSRPHLVCRLLLEKKKSTNGRPSAPRRPPSRFAGAPHRPRAR